MGSMWPQSFSLPLPGLLHESHVKKEQVSPCFDAATPVSPLLSTTSAYRAILNQPLKSVREILVNQTAHMLACYRKNCANPSAASQVRTGRHLQECKALLSSISKRPTVRFIRPHSWSCPTPWRCSRSTWTAWWKLRLWSAAPSCPQMTGPTRGCHSWPWPWRTRSFCSTRGWSRWYATAQLRSWDQWTFSPSTQCFVVSFQHNMDTSGEALPAPLRCSEERLSDSGVFLLENGHSIFLWLGQGSPPDLIQNLFNLPSLAHLQAHMVSHSPQRVWLHLFRLLECERNLSKQPKTLPYFIIGFDPRLGQTKDRKNGTRRLSAWYLVFRVGLGGV